MLGLLKKLFKTSKKVQDNRQENLFDSIKSYIDENLIKPTKASVKTKFDSLTDTVSNEISSLSKQVSKNQESTNEILNYFKEKVETAEKKKQKALESLKDSEYQISDLTSRTSELDSKLKTVSLEKSSLESDKKVLTKNLASESNKLKACNSEIKDLQSLKDTFMSDKVMNLLDSVLNNHTLAKYREENKIVGKDSNSILNLLLNLSNPQIFVKSYYKILVEFKKENQEVMGDDEVAFYEAINKYFGEEVIVNPSKKLEERSFDKKIHRGINLESIATIIEKIILIPSDTTNNDKIKVKVK